MKFDNVVIFSIETTRDNNLEIVASTEALAAKSRGKGRKVNVVTLLRKRNSSSSKFHISYEDGGVDLRREPQVGVYINGHHGTYSSRTPNAIHQYLSGLRGADDYVIGRINVVMCRFIGEEDAPQQVLDNEMEATTAIHDLVFALRQYGQTPTIVIYAKPVWVYNEYTYKTMLRDGIGVPSYMRSFDEANIGRKFWMSPLTHFVKSDKAKNRFKLRWQYERGVGYRIENATMDEIPEISETMHMPNLNRFDLSPLDEISMQPVLLNPPWQPDGDVTHCPQCPRQFTFFTRRHHCRKCGKVVCNQCSGNREVVDRPASRNGAVLAISNGMVRVCNACFNG